jgi:tetratricopeptide (TPR) repeat protein
MTWLAVAALLIQSVDYQSEGLKALDAQQYEAATELFKKAVQSDPQDYAAHFHLGLAYSLQQRHAEAIPEYKKVLELKPGLYEAELNLGISLVRVKNAAEAVGHLKSATDQKPQDARAAYSYAQALADSNQDAEAAFAKAASLDPKSAAAEAGWALALLRTGKLAEADPHFRKAAALDPAYKSGLLQLAEAYETRKDSDAAIAIYREFPGDPGAQERMGALLAQSGKSADAIPALEAAVAKSPTTANRVALAQAYVQSKQTDKAAALMPPVIAAEPNDFELRMFYARMLRDLKKYNDSAQQFLAASKLKPEAPQPWNEISGIMIAAEQYPQALAALDQVRARNAETSAHYYLRAISYDHLHQLKEALANYNKFLEMSRDKMPDEEFKARQRARIIQNELNKR